MPKKIALITVFVILGLTFFYLDIPQYLTLTSLKANQQIFQEFYQQNQAIVLLGYFLFYILITAFSLPGAAVMTLLAGALFGFLWGTILVSFASSIGATLAFLFARLLFQDSLEKRFHKQLMTINQGLEKDGILYLFSLRLVPLIPFFVINLVMGISRIKTFTFYWVSQVGMFAGTLVYVNAGTQLAKIESLSDIFSPMLIGSFVLIGIFPWVAKTAVALTKSIRQNKQIHLLFTKPKTFDRNLIVIGAGSGGLIASYIASMLKAKVTLIEKQAMGGDCLNTGCVPSKALIKSAKVAHLMRHGEQYGLTNASPKIDLASVMKKVHQAITKIEPHDSIERYQSLGVEVITGEATIKSPWEVMVNGQTISTRNIVIATGAEAQIPNIKGIENIDYDISDTLWNSDKVKQLQGKRCLILGGGPIGCELAQSLQRLDVQITLLQRSKQLLPKEDDAVGEFIQQRFEQEGMKIFTQFDAQQFSVNEQGETILKGVHQGQAVDLVVDHVICAIGRKPRVTGFGVEDLNIALNSAGAIQVDEYLRTSIPSIFAIGDVIGSYQFTHTAAHMAWFASINSLFGKFKKFKADFRIVPWATFTDPEVARVGLNEKQAIEQGIKYTVTQYNLNDLDRSITDLTDYGWIKVLTPPNSDQILGVTYVGEHAGDLIAEFIFAMKHRLGLNKILATIHIYPTLAEGNKMLAGAWKKQQNFDRWLKILKCFHQWMRKSS